MNSSNSKKKCFFRGIALFSAAVLACAGLFGCAPAADGVPQGGEGAESERSPKLSLSVRGAGSGTLDGAAEGAVNADESAVFDAETGERLALSAAGEFSYFFIDGIRVTEKEVAFTVPERDVSVTAVFGKADAEFDVYTPDVIVAEAEELGQSADRPFFPCVAQADDGTVVVVYYEADGHALYNQSEGKLSGVLKITRSKNNAVSWSEPETLVDLRDEVRSAGDFNREPRDPNLQKLSDGTLLLTFPVRAPIGKAGYNGSNLNDYWSERSYYMTSRDGGETWSKMRVIECDSFSDEPFLYDDPTRTTGTWVKNGSVAELSNGELLIPLYGAPTCDTRADYTAVVVRARLTEEGTLSFYKDWAKDDDGNPTDASRVSARGAGNELALTAKGDTVYALLRTAIPSRTAGGVVYRSADGGITWEEYALEPTANACLNQPNFLSLGGDLVLVNYSVPLASVYDSPARRTARPVYGKLFNVKTGEWSAYDAVTLYDTETATVADMANPASVLLSDGRIFTVFYDTSAPNDRAGFIGGRFTTLSDYLSETSPDLEETLDAYCAN